MTDMIDARVLDELAEAMGNDFAVELITTFLSEAPGMFGDLKSAYSNMDVDGYRRAAHSIKSNAQIFGATILAEQARAIELDEIADDDAKITALEKTFETTAIALKEHMGE